MYEENNPILNHLDKSEEIETAQVTAEETAQEDAEVIGEVAPEEIQEVTEMVQESVEAASEVSQAQGVFSTGYQEIEPEAPQQTYTTASSGQVWSAKDIQPRKKTGWGKRIAILLLCGVLLGSAAAAAYLSVMYVGERFGITKSEEAPAVGGQDSVVKKEPEISQVQPVDPTEIDRGQFGVVYDVSDVVDNVMPAMVSIINKYTETISSFWGQSYTQENASSGSGIIIGENETEILIATNYHVVSGSDAIEITFIDESTAQAYIKGTNPQMDLAVVSVALNALSSETKAGIAVANLGNSDELKMGQPVIAIGNALGYGQSVTTGVVSAVNREITIEEGYTGNFIQTDAAINPGNSGGALLNMKGEVIGINSNKIGGSAIEGMGYAIPISAAEPIISDLSLQTTKIKVDEANRGYLGVTVQEVTAAISQSFGMPQGVYIAEIEAGSAAEAAGMQVRDIIVRLDSFEVGSYADLQEALQYFAAGTAVKVEVMRPRDNSYERVTLELTLGQRKAQ